MRPHPKDIYGAFLQSNIGRNIANRLLYRFGQFNLSSRIQLTLDFDGVPTKGVFTRRPHDESMAQYNALLGEITVIVAFIVARSSPPCV